MTCDRHECVVSCVVLCDGGWFSLSLWKRENRWVRVGYKEPPTGSSQKSKNLVQLKTKVLQTFKTYPNFFLVWLGSIIGQNVSAMVFWGSLRFLLWLVEVCPLKLRQDFTQKKGTLLLHQEPIMPHHYKKIVWKWVFKIFIFEFEN